LFLLSILNSTDLIIFQGRLLFMTISSAQFDTWSHVGASVTSASTYTSVKTALDLHTWPTGVTCVVYLQGSYRNSTNIRGDSDVDIIVQCTSLVHDNTDLLTAQQKVSHAQSTFQPTYYLSHFKDDVITALSNYYGSQYVNPSSKSIKLLADIHNNRLNADIVPCITHRSFFKYVSGADDEFLEGIAFWAQSDWIVNFPKFHYSFGTEKNDSSHTLGRYKPMVRIFKNAKFVYNRRFLMSLNTPSYFIENLLYNVDDSNYQTSKSITFDNCLIEMTNVLTGTSSANIQCQNHIVSLFGAKQYQWNIADAIEFVRAMMYLRDNY
jgi:hypothetical protein